jgi:hypothetical protein
MDKTHDLPLYFIKQTNGDVIFNLDGQVSICNRNGEEFAVSGEILFKIIKDAFEALGNT